jgi:hypothetical protein
MTYTQLLSFVYIIGVYISIKRLNKFLPTSKPLWTVQFGGKQSSGVPNTYYFEGDARGGQFLPASCRLRPSSATHLCWPVPIRNAGPTKVVQHRAFPTQTPFLPRKILAREIVDKLEVLLAQFGKIAETLKPT